MNRLFNRVYVKLFIITILFMVISISSVNAHLLNMTKVHITINEQGEVDATIELDLAREFSSDENYYTLSQIDEPLSNDTVQAMLKRLKQAMVMKQGTQVLTWQLTSIAFPDEKKEAFISDVSWPMTTISLTSTLVNPSDVSPKLSVMFLDSFAFEEPIALTMKHLTTGRKMSRWLVANQTSPNYALNPASSKVNQQFNIASQWGVVKDYIVLGMKHIVPMGWDHVLFILGLFLGLRSVGNLLGLVTMFTVAHSFTLALSAYGAIQVPAAIIEPLIAASIAWVAIENIVFPQTGRWRYGLVLMFGLLHGLGFAAALRELELPTDGYLLSLLSFNIGIELAQIAIVASAYFLVGWLRNTAYWRVAVVIPSSLLIAIVAGYWTVSRIV